MRTNVDTVSLKALDDLTGALSRLKAQGGALRGKECWINGWDSALEYQQLERVVEASQSSLTRLKDTRDTLSHHGFAHLSDEILGSIFEFCDDGEEDGYKSARFCNVVSRVCHRFRAIALNLPKLWARVSIIHSPAELKLRLARSQNRWLTVELIIDYHSEFIKCRKTFFELVLEHKERWKAFKFIVWEGMTVEHRTEVFTNLASTTQFLELPSLTDLTINDDYRVSASTNRTEGGFIPEFYLSWKLPSLSSVHLGHHVPRPALWTEIPSDLRWKPTLTSVHFRSFGIEEELDMLLRFLSTQPNLRDLSVTLLGTEDVNEEELDENLFVTNLPNLRSLSLTSYSSLMAQRLCHALVMPNVERLYLHFDLSPPEDKNDTEKDLSMLLFEHKSASLKTLSLTVDTKRPYYTASEAILHYYDKLEHLALEGPYLWPPDDRVDSEKHVRLPRLRTLRLTDCPRMEALFVEELAAAFASRSEIAEAGSVEIIRKSGLRRDLEQSCLRDKVDWYERPARTRF
ncbi:hypothetical protein DFH11DRAFT_1724139 [Phellopilus nigrolimitatus]|nr:hypothetical protein DFH11DRAFT_1724139 [Phellopilus nigrolimitatus]